MNRLCFEAQKVKAGRSQSKRKSRRKVKGVWIYGGIAQLNKQNLKNG
jgi:hypothetical protein